MSSSSYRTAASERQSPSVLPLTDRKKLEQDAANAMRAAGRIPEPKVLAALPDEMLKAIIERNTGPLYVA